MAPTPATTRSSPGSSASSPLDFLPPLPGWQERSRFRLREGNLEVFDFDPYSQALSKLQRGFELDLADVRSMVESGQVEPAKLRELFEAVGPELFRFPAVDPTSCGPRLDLWSPTDTIILRFSALRLR